MTTQKRTASREGLAAQETTMQSDDTPAAVDAMPEADLVAEMQAWLRGRPKQRWSYIANFGGGNSIYEAEFYADGTCSGKAESPKMAKWAAAKWGPGHTKPDPDRMAVLRALVDANRKYHERCSASAKLAAKTRAKRREALVYQVAQRFLRGEELPPALNCRICEKAITDPASQRRGIGSDCWQGVLDLIQQIKERAAQGRPS